MLLCVVLIDVILAFAATSRELRLSLVTKQNVSLDFSLFCLCHHLPSHLTTKGSSAVINNTQYCFLFVVMDCIAPPGNSGFWLVFSDRWILEKWKYGLCHFTVAMMHNVQSNYCDRLKYVSYSNLNSPVCKIWGNLYAEVEYNYVFISL